MSGDAFVELEIKDDNQVSLEQIKVTMSPVKLTVETPSYVSRGFQDFGSLLGGTISARKYKRDRDWCAISKHRKECTWLQVQLDLKFGEVMHLFESGKNYGRVIKDNIEDHRHIETGAETGAAEAKNKETPGAI